jgi:hypothetical protein
MKIYKVDWLGQRTAGGGGSSRQLQQLARELGCQHMYLGYRVDGCPSLTYKGMFRPHELLMGRPALDEEPVWLEAQRSSTPLSDLTTGSEPNDKD